MTAVSGEPSIGADDHTSIIPMLRRGDNLLAKLEGWLAILGGLIVVAMTCGVLLDVASRRFLGQSEGLGQDIAEMSLLILTYSTAGYLVRHDGHVRVDVLTARFSAGFNRRLVVVTTLLALIFGLLLLVQGFGAWQDTIQSNKGTTSLHLPQWWFAVAIPVGSFLLVVEMLIVLAKQVAAVVKEGAAKATERRARQILSAPAGEVD